MAAEPDQADLGDVEEQEDVVEDNGGSAKAAKRGGDQDNRAFKEELKALCFERFDEKRQGKPVFKKDIQEILNVLVERYKEVSHVKGADSVCGAAEVVGLEEQFRVSKVPLKFKDEKKLSSLEGWLVAACVTEVVGEEAVEYCGCCAKKGTTKTTFPKCKQVKDCFNNCCNNCLFLNKRNDCNFNKEPNPMPRTEKKKGKGKKGAKEEEVLGIPDVSLPVAEQLKEYTKILEVLLEGLNELEVDTADFRQETALTMTTSMIGLLVKWAEGVKAPKKRKVIEIDDDDDQPYDLTPKSKRAKAIEVEENDKQPYAFPLSKKSKAIEVEEEDELDGEVEAILGTTFTPNKSYKPADVEAARARIRASLVAEKAVQDKSADPKTPKVRKRSFPMDSEMSEGEERNPVPAHLDWSNPANRSNIQDMLVQGYAASSKNGRAQAARARKKAALEEASKEPTPPLRQSSRAKAASQASSSAPKAKARGKNKK